MCRKHTMTQASARRFADWVAWSGLCEIMEAV